MLDIVDRLLNAAALPTGLYAEAADEIVKLRVKVVELEQVLSEENCPRKYVKQGGYVRCLYGTSSIAAYETLSADRQSRKSTG